MKTIVILQPSYLPWVGYFNQILKSDHFVFLDDVLYTKNDWRNRNRIKTPTGVEWLTVPVDIKGRTSKHLLIKDAKVKNNDYIEDHLKKIELNYKKSKYFKEFFPLLTALLNKNHVFLSDMNIEFINLVMKYLGVKNKKFLKSSDFNIKFNNSTERLIKICKELKTTDYLTGDSAKNYLDESLFAKNGIKVIYHNYNHPLYNQKWGEFVPYLSVIDLILNEGKKSLKYIR